MTIIVNGESYIKREDKKRNIPKSVAKAMILAEMFGSYDGYGKKYERKLPDGIDLIKEFEFVLQRKSKLSKWNRDEVTRQFNKIYIKQD